MAVEGHTTRSSLSYALKITLTAETSQLLKHLIVEILFKRQTC